MNVLFFTSWYPTRSHSYSGVFVREHAKAAREAGHQVVVMHLAGPRSHPDDGMWTMEEELDPSLSEGIEAHHVHHRRYRLRGTSYPLYLLSAINAYRRVRDGGFRPDVLHAHVYGAGVPAALIGNRTGLPVVLTEHFSGFPLRTLNRIEVRKARFACEHAARVLPVSAFLREAIRSYGIDVPFEVVPNVVDTSLFFPPSMGRKHGPEPRLIFVGNLEPMEYKGFPTLLRALAHLGERRRDWRLDVFGGGPELERYEKYATAHDLRERVSFHGSRPKQVVAETMRAADLFVLPSRVETFGTAIAEALASGLPVVSTTVGAIPELVDATRGLLVPPDDATALADALDKALESIDSFDRRAIAEAARDRYSSNEVGRRLSQIYESVLAERRG